ncbi:phospholipase C [Paraburkholderia caballeronis]|uniref:alkaline phosphatase family protein n=1 Tax=Paraburkholderia caballeronis TaxID=416943 RepID=UPI001065B181|nr:alkaline phosphatase family protein [Paraburkholderia caballeronis]TDV25024.1 phospholipase C [Paraburkholderia caballeronis]
MKLRALTLACSAALLSLAGCGGSDDHPSSSTVTVSGVAAQGIPVVGVPVTLTDSTGKAAQSAVTDSNGHYSIVVTGKAPFVLTVPVTDADGTPTVLSAVIDPASSGAAIANLNPLTTIVTQRLFGAVLTSAPTATQISGAKISSTSIKQAATDVNGVLQPLYTAFGVPANAVSDPFGNASYEANSSNPLDNLFDIAHFTVHTNTVNVGVGTGGSNSSTHQAVQLPLTGAMPAPLQAGPVAAALALNNGPTTTPIQHVIVIVGENQTFDGLFGGYVPPSGQTVKNLLSEGIINADGSPGPNFSRAAQNQGATQTAYTINPTRSSPFSVLPQPETTGILNPTTLTTAGGTPDARFPANLPNGPFQISKYVPYATSDNIPPAFGITLYASTGDPVHRFFQMWQQTGGDNSKLDMFTWVATTVGQGGDTVSDDSSQLQITPQNPAQGGELMGFMNMSAGDAPYFKSLAQQFAISDNYHQSVMGGTGMNFFQIATGDMPWFNSAGAVATPPANQIENPNPLSGTPNFYTQDGYEGGSYVNCSDASQPGVGTILSYLAAKNVPSNCEPGKFYLVNNYNPGYETDGTPAPIGPNNFNYPPQTVPTIAESLAQHKVSWKWYTGARDAADVTAEAALLTALAAQAGVTLPQAAAVGEAQAAQYNNIGDPLVASTNVITNPALNANLNDLTSLDRDITGGTLPSVSYVVPKNLDSGHPGYSAPATLEAFLQHVVGEVQANPALWANTAILVTTDEGGGHFDTGPIQNLDFFGDGPRIPMLVVSPYARTGMVDHTYYDHASVLKFIERNWRLPPLSKRSRDRLPNPVASQQNAYLPANSTAIGDLMPMFSF